MEARLDFKRYNNGCSKLQNMLCTTQGPVARRPGTEFIYNLNDLVIHDTNPAFRLIPFVFNELQSYVLIFYYDAAGAPQLAFARDQALLKYTEEYEPVTAVETHHVTTSVSDNYDLIDIGRPAGQSYDIFHVNDADSVVTEITAYGQTSSTPDYLDHNITITAGPTTPGDIETYYSINGAVGDPVILALPADFSIETFDYAQSADVLYLAQAGLQPQTISRYADVFWAIGNTSFLSQPSVWDDDYGWPERVTLHQQRLVYAASLFYRQTVWMSAAGSFTQMDLTSGTPVDSDSVDFTLDSGTQNKIVWLLSGKALNVGTIGNEWTVVGSTGSAITPSNVLAKRQTNLGSEPIRPLLVGQTALFVERFGRSINEFVYDYVTDSYKTSDMAILSKHVTDLYSIIDWTYQQTPDSILWGVRSDGTLIGITYQRQHEVIGWHRHPSAGDYKAITSIPGSSREDEVYFVVQRLIAGEYVNYLERLSDQFLGEENANGRVMPHFTDSHVHFEIADGPHQVLLGLDHLDNEEVQIVADGLIHPPITVDNGTITLNDEYDHVILGLGYVSEVWPTSREVENETGSVLGRVQRITNLDIDFFQTLEAQVGRYTTENGEEVEDLVMVPLAQSITKYSDLFTGIYHHNFQEGFDREAVYFIRQVEPMPMTVRAVVDTIEVFE